jgi:hypothetical protein
LCGGGGSSVCPEEEEEKNEVRKRDRGDIYINMQRENTYISHIYTFGPAVTWLGKHRIFFSPHNGCNACGY